MSPPLSSPAALPAKADDPTTRLLRESEERLALAIEIGELASWDWDLRSGKVTWSDRHFLMQGYAVGEVTPSYDAWMARVHPEDRAAAFALIDAAREDKGTYVHTFRILRPDGSISWGSARGRFFYDEDGAPYRMIGVMEDATERKRGEEALSEELRNTKILQDLGARLVTEENIQTIYEEILSAAIAITRAQAGTVQMLDAASEELVVLATRGFSRRTEEYFQRVHAGSNTSCGLALRTGTRSYFNFERESADLSIRLHAEDGVFSAQSSPLVSRSGKAIGMVSTHWGETDRRPSERELRFLDLLARQAADLIEQWAAEKGLRESEARLREADGRKNQFLAMLGHELRNPLAAIHAGLQLLASPKAKPESKDRALPTVLGQTAYMERLIDDLLEITRIVQGRVVLRKEPMVIQDAVIQALEMCRPQSEAGGFEIAADLPAEPLRLVADPVRLTQVFVNIIGNAMKYSGAARRIDVAAAEEDGEAVVRIRDYGHGIAAELLPRIFDPFVQAETGLTLDAGMGMGLAVVKELVRLHGGQVGASSPGLGQGSEFVVRLPKD